MDMEHLETNQRANNIIKTLNQTKVGFKAQIFAIVEARSPLKGLSNLAALNILMDPTIRDETKKATAAAIADYAKTSPQLAKDLSMFSWLLDDPSKIEEWRKKLHDNVFHPDKEKVNDYLVSIAAYIDYHVDSHIKFITLVRDYFIIEKKMQQGDASDLIGKQHSAILHQIQDMPKSSLVLPITTLLTDQFLKQGKDDWFNFWITWLENILQTLLTYQKKENILVKEYAEPHNKTPSHPW